MFTILEVYVGSLQYRNVTENSVNVSYNFLYAPRFMSAALHSAYTKRIILKPFLIFRNFIFTTWQTT